MSYLFETHYHTPYTSYCGSVTPAQAFPFYAQNGYSGIVITDHYYKEWFDGCKDTSWNKKIDHWLEGYKIARTVGRQHGMKVILGMELRFTENANDYLVYGIDEQFLRTCPEIYKMTPAQFRVLADKHGLLFSQAHPFRSMCTPCDPKALHGVEIYNGNPRHTNQNNLAKKFAEDNNLIITSGSDTHEKEDVCRGGVFLNKNPNNSKELAELLFTKNVGEIRIS